MANFVVNSEAGKAIRLNSIIALKILEAEEYQLIALTANSPYEFVFETDETLEGIQGKAVTLLAALG